VVWNGRVEAKSRHAGGFMQFVTAHGAKIPAIGFGTWPMRGRECVRAVVAALQAGYRHVDTAAGYANEQDVGEAIRSASIRRDEIFVTTKIGPSDLAEGDMQRAVAASLRKLGMDHVDLILIHWPSRTLPVADTIRPLNDVKRRGMASHIGVSNFTTTLLAEAWEATDEPIAVNQCEYHPRLNQDKVIGACRARGMAFTSYSPIGRGDALGEPVVQRIAERLHRTAAQVVLRWHIQQDGVIAIPKSAHPERIRENFGVFDFALEADDMAAISGLAQPNGRILLARDIGPEWDD
jgi:diketogulonate reductase-like aldo/keto reductase